ncbi:MAG TPA: hypothetical protein VFJ85_15415 [Acidimicrobiales bacterium]|nr:hypothetical protein [Acidimicrobiales bacterium]
MPRPPVPVLVAAGAGLLALTLAATAVLSGPPPQAAEHPTTTTAPRAATASPPVQGQAQVSLPVLTTVAPPRAHATPAAPVRTAAPPAAGRSTAGSPAEKGAAALALVHYPIDQTGFRVTFEGERQGILGMTFLGSRTITVYVRSSQSVGAVARVLAHEVGHAVDASFTTEAERSQYRAIRGIGGGSWYSDCTDCSDYGSPSGDFAEVFAYWLLGDGTFLSTMAGKPTASQLAQLGPIFAPSPQAPAVTTTTTPPVTAPPTTTTTKPAAQWQWSSSWTSGTGSSSPYPYQPRR